jgi:hypothetical protein
VWDYKRDVILHKVCAAHGCTLRMIRGRYGEARGIEGYAPRFELDLASGQRVAMSDVSWADWDHSGRLLVATKSGRLQARDVSDVMLICEEHDLTNMTPLPAPPPFWASVEPGRARM